MSGLLWREHQIGAVFRLGLPKRNPNAMQERAARGPSARIDLSHQASMSVSGSDPAVRFGTDPLRQFHAAGDLLGEGHTGDGEPSKREEEG